MFQAGNSSNPRVGREPLCIIEIHSNALVANAQLQSEPFSNDQHLIDKQSINFATDAMICSF